MEILEDGRRMRRRLRELYGEQLKPAKLKTMRKTSLVELAQRLGVSDTRIRQLVAENVGPGPEKGPNGRLYFDAVSAAQLMLGYQQQRLGRPWMRRPQDKLQVVAVANFKGGSGKTTHAVHLAEYLALRGYRVLAVDMDPQASMTEFFGRPAHLDEDDTMFSTLRFKDRRVMSEVIHESHCPLLWIAPASLQLMDFDIDVAIATRANPNERSQVHRLAVALAEVQDDFDVVVVDCPPQLGFLTLNAMIAATSLIVTVHPQMMDVASMSHFLTSLGEIVGQVPIDKGKQFDVSRYLLTRLDRQDVSQQQCVTIMRGEYRERVLLNEMVQSTAVSEAALGRETVYEMVRDPRNGRALDRAVEAMNGVNGEIESLLRNVWGVA